MIYKQNESLKDLKSSLVRIGEQHNLLLERFFFSLTPTEMRSCIETESLKALFLLLLQAMKSDSSDWLFKQDSKKVLAIIPHCDSQKRKRIQEQLEKGSFPQIITFSLDFHETPYSGYMILTDYPDIQERFLKIISIEIK